MRSRKRTLRKSNFTKFGKSVKTTSPEFGQMSVRIEILPKSFWGFIAPSFSSACLANKTLLKLPFSTKTYPNCALRLLKCPWNCLVPLICLFTDFNLSLRDFCRFRILWIAGLFLACSLCVLPPPFTFRFYLCALLSSIFWYLVFLMLFMWSG